MIGLFGRFGPAVILATLVVVATTITAAVVAVRRRRAGKPVLVPTARVAAIGSVLLIAAATAMPLAWPPRWEGLGDLVLTPGRAGLSQWRVVLDAPGSLAAVLLVANLVLYVPLALAATIGWRARAPAVLAACLGLSVAVETVQLTLLGRVAAIDDVILNMVGAVIGASLAVVAVPRDAEPEAGGSSRSARGRRLRD